MRRLIVVFCLLSYSRAQVIEGLLHLDEISFDKIVSKFQYSLIKFDVGYPTGDKHNNFGTLAKETAGLGNLFLGEVRVKDYGEKANQALAERFNVNHEKQNLPETVLFTTKDGGGLREVVRYGGDYSLDNLRLFISSKTGVYIKCDGCIKELDVLAEKFALASSKADREKILFSAESWAKEEGEGGDVYVKIMRGALDTGKEGLIKEKERLAKLLEKKSSDKVKEKLTRKQNVLGSFRYRKEEL